VAAWAARPHRAGLNGPVRCGVVAYAGTPVCPCPARVAKRAAPGAGLGDGWGGGGGGSWPAGPDRRPVGSGPSKPCSPRRCGPPPPLASPCRRGVVRTRLVGGPPVAGAGRVVPSWCSRQDRHRAVGGRGAVSPPAVRCRTGWRPRWPARGAVPRGRAWAGDRSRGRSVAMRVAKVPAVRALLPARRALRGRAPPRAPCAPAAKCVWGSLPRAQSPTHTAVRRLARRAAAAPRWASPRT
jgi:hypothetical protein